MTETAADEQDLAKALDSVANAAAGAYGSGTPATPNPPRTLLFEETPSAGAVASPFSPPPPPPTDDTPVDPLATPDPEPSFIAHLTDNDNGPLESIKKDALVELRPLVDKLNVSPEEKFDTYLLLIRSTDDTDLIGPAHEAAKAITDETRRAEALLDIIKEIDYLSHPKNA
jgi:hypothetical protein